MLKAILSLGQLFEPKANSAVLKMKSHERMAGSVPVWEKASTAKQQTEQRFADALSSNTSDSLYRLSLTEENKEIVSSAGTKPFGFGDLIDMVNPLHHIPILGSFYRNLTGDEIRGPGQIIGGAIYGGPIGAASSMINMLVKYDTGKDLTGHAMNMAIPQTSDQPAQKVASFASETKTTADVNDAIMAYQKQAGTKQAVSYIRTTRL